MYGLIGLVLYLLLYNSEIECACDKALGIAYDPVNQIVKDEQLSASSHAAYMDPKYGRLDQPMRRRSFGTWCASEDATEAPWFQVSFNSMTTVTKVAIGANEFVHAYIKSFYVKYSYNGKFWYNVTGSDWVNKAQVFQGMKDTYNKVTVNLGQSIVAKYFRIYPLTKYENFCLQTEFYGCDEGTDCNKAVGVADKSIITDDKFSASSSYLDHKPSDGRLNNILIKSQGNWGAWCANAVDVNPWLGIDLGYVRKISKIATQGHPFSGLNAWVTEYKLNYSTNYVDWFQYHKVFQGNINGKTKHVHTLVETILARYVKFLPVNFHELPCLRIEVYECVPRPGFIPKLSKGLKNIKTKRGEKLELTCQFVGQPGMELGWYKNKEYLISNLRIRSKQIILNRTVTGKLTFIRLKSEENGAMFTCRAWYPTLEDVHASSSAFLSVEAPVATVKVLNVSHTEGIFSIGFTGAYTKDVTGYMIRIRTSNHEMFQDYVSFENEVYYNVSLHPYRNYTVETAMVFIGDEVGKFLAKEKFQTLQDKPYGPPLGLGAVKTSHNSLFVSWGLPEEELRNGPIIHYEVRYVKSAKKDEKEVDVVKYALTNDTSIGLLNLEAGSNYEIATRAFTEIGAGPFNHPPTLIFTGLATKELTSINEMVITEGNAVAVGVRLKNITSNPNFLNKHDVVLAVDILEKVVEAQNSSELIGESLVASVSNVLKANKSVLAESEITNRTGTRYVKMLEKWLENVETEEKDFERDSENLIVKKIILNKDKIEEGIKFAEAENEIVIPTEAFVKNETKESIFFVYYKKNKFFTGKKKLEETCVDGFTVVKERIYTPVLSGEIVGQNTRNLSVPVVLRFKADQKVNLKESACVYWDFNANDKKGAWSQEGCVLHSVVNQTITCHCSHLTNFAAMMDVYAQTSKVCGRHQVILTYISVIGCFMSMIGLFLTFLTYLLFRRLLKEKAAKVLIQLCVSLLVVIVAFYTGIEQTDKPYICTTVAVILHYFTLVSFMWMLMEAFFMYHAFVRVWPPREGGDIIRSTVVAWGIPFFIVLVTFLTSSSKYGGPHYCHVHGMPLYASYLTPIGLIIFVNLILFSCIMYRLSTRPNSSTDQSNIEIAFTRLRRAFGIMILMGLSWAFGFGSASNARLEFTYLFAICNGLQGFAIFIFYCLAQKNARVAWYRFFTCDTRSERKITTDSFYERSRLSSNVSNRTNTLQFKRVGSNASSVFSSPPQERFNSDASMLKTIEEIDSPVESINKQFSSTDGLLNKRDMIPGNRDANLLAIDENDGLNESADDDILNMKLQKEENRKSKPDIKEYCSYRALSSAFSHDVLNKAISSKSLNKDGLHVRSSECLHKSAIRDETKNDDARKSMIENKVPLSPGRQNVRPCDKFTNDTEEEIAGNDAANVDLTAYRNIGSTDGIDKETPKLRSNTDNTISHETGTIKSDVATMTEETDHNSLLRPPLYELRGMGEATGRPENEIVSWLHDCDHTTEAKDTDSDYSSSYYKTSRSSSMADLHSPTSRFNFQDDLKSKDLLNNTVIGPLRSPKYNNNNNSNNPKHKKKKHSLNCASDSSEDGYSASEEDLMNSDSKHKLKPKKKKTRNRLNAHQLRTNQNAYISLDTPTAHVSYV